MKNRASYWMIALVAWAAPGPAARAEDQVVSTTVTLAGFSSSEIQVGFKSTDLFDIKRTCTTGKSQTCTKKNGYGSPPKNIGNFLCLPASLSYAISAACQQLLSQGATQKCNRNDTAQFCEAKSPVAVVPACYWRTNDNKSPVTWTWTLTWQQAGSVAVVDCASSNYQGPRRQ